MPDFRSKLVANAGLQLPSGAASGRVATSDGSGNVSWSDPGAAPVPTVTNVLSSGDTGLVGTGFTQVPGMSTTLSCAAGRGVMVFGGVFMQWNTGGIAAFAGWRPSGGSWTYGESNKIRPQGGGLVAGDDFSVPIGLGFTPGSTGDYEIAAFVAGDNAGAGYGLDNSWMTILRFV